MNNSKKILMVLSIILVAAAIILITISWGKNESQLNYTGEMEPRLGYVELQVSDLEDSIDFYQEIIGLKLLEKNDEHAAFSADGENPLLSLVEETSSVQRPFRSTGLYHLALLVPDQEELSLVLKHLIEKEYPIQGISDHQYSEAVYLADPDNNGIEIYADRDPELWIEDDNGGYVGGTEQADLENLFSQIKTDNWDGLSPATRLGHMHLQVSDIEESEKFYVDALGFNVVSKNSNMLFVSKDDYHHHIGMNTWAGEGLPQPPANAVGMRYYTVHFTEDEYIQAKEDLSRLGFSYTEEENDEIFTEDPAGNQLRIILR